MVFLTGWVKELLTLLVLAGFLELILPDNQLKAVTKMVLGLVIIVVLAGPLLDLLKVPSQFDWQALNKAVSLPLTKPDTRQVFQEATGIQNKWRQKYLLENQAEIEKKIKRVISKFQKVGLQKIRWDLADLEKMTLKVSLNSPKVLLSEAELQKIRAAIQKELQIITNYLLEKVEVT